MDRWPERLAGREVRAVDAHGKHLFIRFDGELTLHSHLRMTGKLGRLPPRRALAALSAARLAGDPHRRARGGRVRRPVLELMTESRTRFDRRLAMLGPDVLAEEFDEGSVPRPPARDDQPVGIGDALLDQRNAGRHRQRVEVRGLLPGRPRSLAAHQRGVR